MNLTTQRPDSMMEIALATCLAEVKMGLDGHMAVYDRVQHETHASTASVSFDELTSIAATQRTTMEWCCMTLDNLNKVGLPKSMWRDKHGLCADMIFKMVARISQNNIIAQRPGFDVVQFALDLGQFIESFYLVLAESTLPHARKQAYDAYMRRPWKVIHQDDGKHDVKLFDRQINTATLLR